ncbi:VWA domain-containing protein [Mycobacterium sp.]|uniref:vWA domain-containing protein n=1 Tax=Mycobacterium sp. TaxID=1785 RepID=UPI0031D0B46B
MSAAALFPGVDLAAFATAVVARLRDAGVLVSASGPAGFVQALRKLRPHNRSELYWAARLTLVNRMEDLNPFDSVFAAVFGDAPAGVPARAWTTGSTAPGARRRPGADGAAALPWATPRKRASGRERAVADPLPSRLVARIAEPFDHFDPDDLRLLGLWLERSVAHWPRRRTLRLESSRHGKRIDLRRTMTGSRSTGWEVVNLARTRRRRRLRRVVLVCDVSRSMRPYAAIYVHLMRAALLRRAGIRPEVFAFSTTLTRLTSALAHRSPEVALDRANAKVTDRFGGTHLGRSVEALLAAPHGNALRGAVVIVASDGWDSDRPEVLGHALARVRRRAELLIWLNPRAADSGYRPLTRSMAAALPHCDLFLPAHSLAGLRELFAALAGRG